MAKEAEAYRGKKTPFLSKHRCAKDSYSLSASTFHKAYYPRQKIAKGKLAAAVLGTRKVVGTVQAFKKKGRGRFICFEEKPDEWFACSKCVRLPVINEFVRHKQTGKWSKVASIGERGTLELLSVLVDDISSEKTTDAAADKSSEKTTDAAADKSSEKPTDAAADKSSEKTTDAAADNSSKKKPDAVAKQLLNIAEEEVITGSLIVQYCAYKRLLYLICY